jgi:hypothetical protein
MVHIFGCNIPWKDLDIGIVNREMSGAQTAPANFHAYPKTIAQFVRPTQFHVRAAAKRQGLTAVLSNALCQDSARYIRLYQAAVRSKNDAAAPGLHENDDALRHFQGLKRFHLTPDCPFSRQPFNRRSPEKALNARRPGQCRASAVGFIKSSAVANHQDIFPHFAPGISEPKCCAVLSSGA